MKPDQRTHAPSFGDLFIPKLVTVLREGYGPRELRADALAGLTVAVVALPLSMAIAIASGVGPERGLYAAIVGGFIVSLLGGSRFQIGGPAGAFIVLVSATVAEHGVDGMVLATTLAGLMLAAAGFLRLGGYVQLVPFPVTVGFTAGIAVIIAASQLKDLVGLSVPAPEPGPIFEKLKADIAAIGSFNPASAGLATAVIATIVGLKRLNPALPGMLIAIAGAAAAAALFNLPVETIADRFGDIPRGLPAPQAPALSFEKLQAILPSAFAFFLLGAIESLLSATVADGMTGRRHRSNCELVAQGAANIASAFFGGLVVTGTIARTATNVRAGAHGPVAGMAHAGFLLAFMIAAAPLIGLTPLPALAGVLLIVAWNMVERHAFANLLRASAGDAAALLVTFSLTVFRDLTEAIIAGVAIGALAFISRMASALEVSTERPILRRDEADGAPETRAAYDSAAGSDVAIFRISGAVFFASAASLGIALERILAGEKRLILDFSKTALIDSSGAHAIAGFVRRARRKGLSVAITAAGAHIAAELRRAGVVEPEVEYAASIDAATRPDAHSPSAER
ncbi:MAG TPA: sodium-independent anion transporter [Parvularcula sp.]|nr:sodium-independent anion transporter [Parvularcula sp.]HBS31173.1 sodium-independent anion transporter [Parvularcula sp.]HBS34321.1 sodium-independent anion transporter [Parvularcula sp.]